MVLVIVIGVLKMKTRLKFIKGEWYRHKNSTDLVCRIIKAITERTFQVELYSIGYDKKTPRTLGIFTTYFVTGDDDWELYDK